MIYTDAHRFFLRVMMNEGVMPEEEAEKIIQRHSAGVDLSLADVVKSVNAQIRGLQQSLKRTVNEVTGARELVLVWCGGGAAALAGAAPQPETAYWRRLLETLATTTGHCLPGVAALNLVSTEDNSITKTRAQELLDSWVKNRYLQRPEVGSYALGPRGLHEFEPYLREHMPDALDICCLCKNAVFHGRSCPNCQDVLHKACLERYLLKVQAWPCCKTSYSGSGVDHSTATEDMEVSTSGESTARTDISMSSEAGPSQSSRGLKRSRH